MKTITQKTFLNVQNLHNSHQSKRLYHLAHFAIQERALRFGQTSVGMDKPTRCKTGMQILRQLFILLSPPTPLREEIEIHLTSGPKVAAFHTKYSYFPRKFLSCTKAIDFTFVHVGCGLSVSS